MKKLISWLLALVMVLTMASCGEKVPGAEPEAESTPKSETTQETESETIPPTETKVDTVKETIYVLVSNRNMRKWETTISKAAQEKADEVNKEGRCTVIVQTCSNAGEMCEQLGAIAANAPTDGSVGVIILKSPWESWPLEDPLRNQLAALEIPYIVAGQPDYWTVSPFMISNIVHDEESIGAAIAAYLVANGMKEGDKVFVFDGFNSINAYCHDGFVKYLQGQKSFAGEKIKTPWTSIDSILFSSITDTGYSDVGSCLAYYLSDADNAATKYIVCWNDNDVAQVFYALRGNNDIPEDARDTLLNGKPYITGCDASIFEFLDKEYNDDLKRMAMRFDGIMSVIYSPELVRTAIQTMADYFDGEKVEQYIELPVEDYIDEASIADYTGTD